MRATIESTEKIIEFNGIPARIWEGITESGVKCHFYITRVSVSLDEISTEGFYEELQEHRPPSVETRAIPLRMNL